jgi:hypothetical protein
VSGVRGKEMAGKLMAGKWRLNISFEMLGFFADGGFPFRSPERSGTGGRSKVLEWRGKTEVLLSVTDR